MPERATVRTGLSGSLMVIDRVAVAFPTAVGAKFRYNEQLSSAARVVPQVPPATILNIPAAVPLIPVEMVRMLLPLLLMVTKSAI